jgi:deoxyribose-phosphate aldolase
MDKLSQKEISKEYLASCIEHTLLGDKINENNIISHLKEAEELNVYGICIPLAWLPFVNKFKNHRLKSITVIDFPLGNKDIGDKILEARTAQAFNADEVDMVLDYQALIKRDYHKALNGLCAVIETLAPIPVKVIVETSALTKAELACACTLVALSGAQFIKTSTGYHQGGALVEDIILMRELLPASIGIKASGGIKSFAEAEKLLKAGATRIGSSRSKDLLAT